MKITTAVALLMLPFMAQQAGDVDVAGEWSLSLSLPLSDANFTMFIEQNGSSLKGYLLNEGGQWDLRGSVAKDQVRFQWTMPDRNRLLTISVVGQLDGTTIRGNATIGDVSRGTIVATRR